MTIFPKNGLRISAKVVPYALVFPIVFSLGLYFVLPIGSFLMKSVEPSADAGGLTLSRYKDILGDPYYLRMLMRSLRIAVFTVLGTLILAYPVALYMWQAPKRVRNVVTVAVLSPLLVSVVVRTMGWLVILTPRGALNDVLSAIGLPTVDLLYTETAVVLALVHVSLGFMVLAILSSLTGIDPDVILAARDLGATTPKILRSVIFPLSIPGVVAGMVIVFTLGAGALVAPLLLGGSRSPVITEQIFQRAKTELNFPLASAFGVVLLLGIALVTAGIVWLGSRSQFMRSTRRG